LNQQRHDFQQKKDETFMNSISQEIMLGAIQSPNDWMDYNSILIQVEFLLQFKGILPNYLNDLN
jgi:hypothetical protein